MIPAHYQFALEELRKNVKEVPGPGNNPRIVEYHKATGLAANNDSVPWCSSFEAWCFMMAKIPYRKSMAAQAIQWLTDPNFKAIKTPILGAVGVRHRTGGNHTFFFSKWIDKEAGTIQILNGNAHDQVEFDTMNIKDVIGWVWPKSLAIPMAATPIRKSTIVQAAAGVAVAAGGSIVKSSNDLVTADNIQAVSDGALTAKQHLSDGSIFGIVIGTLIFAGVCYVIYARWRGGVKDRAAAEVGDE